jgi:GNAT superfamily N-acetyltransferase
MHFWLATTRPGVQVLIDMELDGAWSATARGDDAAAVAHELERIARALPSGTRVKVDGSARVRFWTLGPFGPESHVRQLAAGQWSDVSPNYPGEVRGDIERLMAHQGPPAGRLALWHGPPGTGKTHAIRALSEAWQAWCDIDYIVDTDEFFGNGHYMASTLLHTTEYDNGADRWRMLVVEDAGEFVRSDARGQGLARLLNLADGLIGQGLQMMVLLTTNEQIEKLHPAMTRPGRCMSNVGFGMFEPDEAAEWLRARTGQTVEVDEPMTLAELYAIAGDLEHLSRAQRLARVNDLLAAR